MTTNLRICLTILSVGFAVEGASELYSWATPGADHAGLNVLFILPTALTLVGLLFVWVGRHEWSELHRQRTRQAALIFGLSLVGGFIAAAVVAVLIAYPSMGTPPWAEVLFGAAIASLLLGTFVTYAFLVFHLVAIPSKAALAAAVAWACIISVIITVVLAGDLPTLLRLIQSRSFTVPSFLAPVNSLVSYLFLSYFLLLAAYIEAHVVVARGLPPGVPRAVPPSASGPSP